MARKGRPRKFVKRELNGRAIRPTLEQIRDADRAQRLAEQSTVLAQPHRRGADDIWPATALGRFVAGQGLRREVYEAGQQYEIDMRRLWAAIGVPSPIKVGEGGLGEGISEATATALKSRLGRVELAIATITHSGWLAMRNLVLFDKDISS